MSIGLGILLLVIGAILTFALEVSIPGVDDNVLGWILMLAGLLCIVLSFALSRRRTRVVSQTHVADPRVAGRVDEVRRDEF